jgi:hypothetical protein
MYEKLIHLGEDRNVYVQLKTAHPFGGVKRFGLGFSIEQGSTGSTYGDSRLNKIMCIEALLGWMCLSFSFTWKGAHSNTL